jgi:hypothetical protein
MFGSQRLLQRKTRRIGIHPDVANGIGKRGERQLAHAQRILVRGEFDTVANAIFTLQFLQRLAGNIGGDDTDGGGSESGQVRHVFSR